MKAGGDLQGKMFWTPLCENLALFCVNPDLGLARETLRPNLFHRLLDPARNPPSLQILTACALAMKRRRFAALPLRSRRESFFPSMTFRSITCAFLAIPLALSAEEKPTPGALPGANTPKSEAAAKLSPELKAALEKLAMPGVKINVEQWCVDVDARVCLTEGMLELIACTKNTKEHEAIIAVEAKPSHIHTALLLLRSKPGNPAMQKALDPEGTRFISIPPKGSAVGVFLVFKDANGKDAEHPISDFITSADTENETGRTAPGEGAKPVKFPTHTFLFAGSILDGKAGEPRNYLCDQSGNVISLATFGDELLCLPGIHEHADSLRMWQVDGEKLPAIDSKITLRLRPQAMPPADAAEGQ